MIHRFPRFHSTESLCGLSYGQVCRLNHAYVIVEHDAHRVDCPNCVGIQSSSRAPQLADKRAAPIVVGCQGTRGAAGIAHDVRVDVSVVPAAVALQEAC